MGWSRQWLRRADSQHPAPFVVGVPRSGTTLLRLMLDAHPELAIPPETHFIPKLMKTCADSRNRRDRAASFITTHRRWPDFALDADEFRTRVKALPDPVTAGSVMRAFYGLYAEKQGKPRWGDKSTSYVRKMAKVARALPEARFVHLIRDGRDVALSQMDTYHGAEHAREAAEHWVAGISTARRHGGRVTHYLEVRYEELVADPGSVLRSICGFVNLSFDEAMLSYHRRAPSRIAEETRDLARGAARPGAAISAEARARQHERVSAPPQPARAGRWRCDMASEDRAAFEAIAGPLLAELGYRR